MDQTDDPMTPEPAYLNGTASVGTTDSSTTSEAQAPAAARAAEPVDVSSLRPGFLSELAVAMRATAERERESIATRVSEDAAAHVDKVRSRAAIETDELRRLAEEDVQHIEEWSASEMERVRAEADQKISDRRASLDDYIQQHNAIIEHEIEGVDKAVTDYNTTLDGFFAELASVEDPATIVARAEALPPPPDLDQVRAAARASAVAMFAEPDEAKPEARPSDDDTTGDGGPTVEAAAPTVATASDAPQAAEFVAPTTDVDAPAETDGAGAAAAIGVSELIAGESAGAVEAAAEPVVATDATPATEATPDPVPVMDPAATGETAWPAPAPEPEPVEVAPSTENQSAAVRLLRSVAPWTAPTHASAERSDTE
jgi:hypothetical protein